MKRLVIYWVIYHGLSMDEVPVGAVAGCGVTALGEDDALQLLQTTVFTGRDLPENIALSIVRSAADLGSKHVLPNSGNMLRRDVWFPLGHELSSQ
ncbi:MAG: hypothetical protein ABJM26_05585 [Anderseniella sp.]